MSNPSTNQQCFKKTLIGHTDWVRSLVVLPDGRLASASDDKTIRLWNTTTGESFKTLTGHTDWVNALVVLQDGTLASGSADNTIRLWNTTTRLRKSRVYIASTGVSVKTLIGHTGGWVRLLVVLPDGRLASASADKTIRLWNTTTGELCKTLIGHTDWVGSLVVLPDGRLASGSADNTIRLWNTTTGESVKTLIGHTGWVRSLVVLPDGRLSSNSGDRTIRLWNTTTGESVKTLIGHAGCVNALVVLQDGTLASASNDKTIRLWNTDTDYHNVLAVCFLPDDEDGCAGDCQICLLPLPLIEKRLKLPRCGHIFHIACVSAWLQISVNHDCPLCRTPV